MAFVADWRIALIVLGVFAVLVLLTRYVSLGSCVAALALGICFTVMHGDKPVVIVFAWLIALTAIFMHRGNLQRLCKGTERKLSFGHKEGRT